MDREDQSSGYLGADDKFEFIRRLKHPLSEADKELINFFFLLSKNFVYPKDYVPPATVRHNKELSQLQKRLELTQKTWIMKDLEQNSPAMIETIKTEERNDEAKKDHVEEILVKSDIPSSIEWTPPKGKEKNAKYRVLQAIAVGEIFISFASKLFKRKRK